MLDLPVFFQIGGGPQRFSLGIVIQRGKADAQGCGERGQLLQRGEREVVVGFDARLEGFHRCRRMRAGDDAADAFERHTLARFQCIDQRVPHVALAVPQRLVRIGAITERVGFRIAQQLGGYPRAVGGHDIERIIRHVAKGEARGVDRLALARPFGSQFLRQRLRADDLAPAALRLDRAIVERDVIARCTPLDTDVLVEPLHSPLLQRLARKIGRMNTSTAPSARKI